MQSLMNSQDTGCIQISRCHIASEWQYPIVGHNLIQYIFINVQRDGEVPMLIMFSILPCPSTQWNTPSHILSIPSKATWFKLMIKTSKETYWGHFLHHGFSVAWNLALELLYLSIKPVSHKVVVSKQIKIGFQPWNNVRFFKSFMRISIKLAVPEILHLIRI